MSTLESLRMCPVCQAIKKFVGTKRPRCQACGNQIPKSNLELYPPVESGRCRSCQTLVAATIDEQCGLCSSKSEHLRRRKCGTLSKDDKSEFSRHRRRIGAKQVNQQGLHDTTHNAPTPEAIGQPGDLKQEDKTVPLSD